MVAGRLVLDGFVRPSFSRKHGVLRLDCLVRTSCGCDSNELGEELAAEHSVVFQSLVATFEPRTISCVAPVTGALRRHRAELEALQQIGPEIGHSASVSHVLQQ